ncbi:PLxRFG domain-containing protein [Buttiauxella selenatireducens]|uniref:PLxRFG domain-containing protein n=1 Tax=Buttiauxella selenatireducens TaxID=3073902 RepID=A0ABY9SGH0_9ENTR|nr:PLxRFG domain-containing protein [Buttiauxella sp. R73]WMY76423.1 PLxRFG domain-containing protein [Buttiauxella sp. R73]
MRKNRIHRKGTEGFTKDAIRAFADHMFHGSHQLSKLEYAMDMGEAIDSARKEAAEDRSDTNRATHLVNEVQKRNEFIMNPTGGAVAHAISQAGFIYHLAATPAAAMVNLSQSVILGVPIMSAYLNKNNPAVSSGKVSKQLIRATADFTRGKGWIEKSKKLTPDEKKAMEVGYATGTIDRTQSHDLAGVAESGISYNATRQKVMKGLGFAFHHAERFNREVTFLASYRLARQEGESHDKAIDTANDLTWKVHFDYQNTSRPRVMQNDTAKVLLLFRNYSANMLYRLARDVYKSINPKDPAERKEALTQFAGITGMMMLHAGVRGTWFFGIATAIASVFMDDGDDPEEEMKKAMIDAIGPTATGLALNGVPGHALGWDLSGRIGMPDLWFRSSYKELEGEDAYNYWLSQAAGAAPSMALNAFKGMAMAAKGNVYRGIETAMPKIIKDQMRAYRYMTDGAETMKGDDILPEMTPWEGISQSLGFAPAALSERYKQNSANMNKQEAILAARSNLLSQYYKADEASNEAELDKLDKEIDKFSDKYPEQKITGKTLNRSIRTREKNSDRNVGGINYNEKLKDRILNEQSMSIYR